MIDILSNDPYCRVWRYAFESLGPTTRSIYSLLMTNMLTNFNPESPRRWVIRPTNAYRKQKCNYLSMFYCKSRWCTMSLWQSWAVNRMRPTSIHSRQHQNTNMTNSQTNNFQLLLECQKNNQFKHGVISVIWKCTKNIYLGCLVHEAILTSSAGVLTFHNVRRSECVWAYIFHCCWLSEVMRLIMWLVSWSSHDYTFYHCCD